MAQWDDLAEKTLAGEAPTRADALAVLASGNDELLGLLQAAFRVRAHYFGRGVRLHVLRNAKSGSCRENCAFCSQSIAAYSGVDRYQMQTVEELVEGAREAYRMKAVRYCMVTATRGPSPKELEIVCEAVKRIKAEMPIAICTSLGLITNTQADQLAAAGVDRFNHNLETSKDHFSQVCQTHTWEDRVATIKTAKAAGLEACCGGIMGLGERLEDRVELAFALRELEVDSIPVNFLDPRPGTAMGHLPKLDPQDCLRTLCMYRFVNPSREIRAAGGREVVLRHMQPLALYPANSMFTEGYLTTGGQGHNTDLEMIKDAGFHVAELVQE